MRFHHSRYLIPAAALALSIHFQCASANPVAAPVPDNAKPIIATTTSPSRLAALKRWNEAKFGLFLHWNRLLDSQRLSAPSTKVAVKNDGCEWQSGPVTDHGDGPFVVVELTVEGKPLVAE